MIEKIIPIYPCEKFECNGYLAGNGKTAVLIDAPTTAVAAAESFLAEGGIIEAILVTHGHFDHIEGLPELARLTNAPVFISEADKDKLSDDTQNRAAFHFDGGFPHYTGDLKTLSGGEILKFECTDIEVMAVPGHTAGCLAFIADNEYCFSGDFVFKRGIGRTDFSDSDEAAMADSLKRFKALNSDLAIFPGHGGDTTLENERKYL